MNPVLVFTLAAAVLLVGSSASAQVFSASFLQTPSPTTTQQPTPAPAPLPSILHAPAEFPAGVKFGFVSFQRIAQESEAGRAASAQLKAFQDVKLLDVQAKSQAVSTLQEKQNATAVMAASAAAQLQKDIERAQMDLQYTQQVAQKEIDDMQRDLMTAFSEKLMPVVELVRAEKGLWAVWAIDDSLVAMMPGLDISMDVVKRLDDQQ